MKDRIHIDQKGKLSGPHTERQVQEWYRKTLFDGKDIKFCFTTEKESPLASTERFTLAELQSINGIGCPFIWVDWVEMQKKLKARKEQRSELSEMLEDVNKKIEALRKGCEAAAQLHKRMEKVEKQLESLAIEVEETSPKEETSEKTKSAVASTSKKEEEQYPIGNQIPFDHPIVQRIFNSKVQVPQKNLDLIEEFVRMFRLYMTAMRDKKLHELHQLGLRALEGCWSLELLDWKSDSPEFIPLAKRVLSEIPKICEEKELVCWTCAFRMFTPVNLLDHLVDPNHMRNMPMLGDVANLHSQAVERILGKLSHLLKRSGPFGRDKPLLEMGKALYKRVAKNPSQLRPTPQHMKIKVNEYFTYICEGNPRASALIQSGVALDPENDEYLVRSVRRWFNVSSNRQRFMKDMEAHLSTGVPHCSGCEVAFDSVVQYYRHMTGYTHSFADQRWSSYFWRLARGTKDWDITV